MTSTNRLDITYAVNEKPSTEEFINVLVSSSLAERRPVEDRGCIEGMLNNANLIVTAHIDNKLIGIARSVTDFHYACYLSDIAVDQQHQHKGIGKRLIQLTQEQLGKRCKLILLSAPDATDYYPKIGFSHHPHAWLLNRDQPLTIDP
ncbi:MAG: GNAT family N-acetyltransferase [Ectothiorhodospiraceae bacterium]|nr:GNAT family N-acetyltransferase [Ectothiorhodospiraceae bacterium]